MDLIKYLIINEEDKNLGFNILHGGHNLIQPNEPYPMPDHPENYKFKWEKGRKLNEYQAIYIMNGKGVFESETAGVRRINSGSIILLFPNEWHRYKPSLSTGWNEYWFGFKGAFADRLMEYEFIRKDTPVLHIGFNEKVFNLYADLVEIIQSEPPGNQMIAAGVAVQIIGMANRLIREKHFEGKELEELIKKSRLMLIENLESPLSPKDIAQKLNLGYSWYRKMFKKYTGLAPGQFQMQHRINKARELLANQSYTIKEISGMLGFESNFHFSKTFKSKTGMTPGQFRKTV